MLVAAAVFAFSGEYYVNWFRFLLTLNTQMLESSSKGVHDWTAVSSEENPLTSRISRIRFLSSSRESTFAEAPSLLTVTYSALLTALCKKLFVLVLSKSHFSPFSANKPGKFDIRAGSTNKSSGGVLMSVVKIFVHDLWDPKTMDFDFAIFQIKGKFTYGPTIAKIPLTAIEPKDGVNVKVSGWGDLSVSICKGLQGL